MISTRLWQLVQLSRRLWVRASLIACLALLANLAALLLEPIIPNTLAERFGVEAAMPVLNVLATSMLAVTTFSLSVMVAAHQQASNQITPRAHRLLLEDTTTQSVLATFLGAFIYSLVAIILARAHVYDDRASVVIFVFTGVVVVMVVLAILRWIEHLSRLGSMDETLRLTEKRARAALEMRQAAPALGAHALERDKIPADARPVMARKTGYVQFIDIPALGACCDKDRAKIFLICPPGDYAIAGQPIALVRGESDPADVIGKAVTIGDTRTFDQDARYGLMVLSEIALRALSPGLNDPGTAIDVIARQERLLHAYAQRADADADVQDGLYVPPLLCRDLVEDAFDGIARESAGLIEVARRLQKALLTLRGTQDPDMVRAAKRIAARGLKQAEAALPLEEDRDTLRRLADL